MAADDIDFDLDPHLARRLATLHPDVTDEGFTGALMARLPERTPPTTIARTRTRSGIGLWPLALAAVFCALAFLPLVVGSGVSAETALFARLGAASENAAVVGGLLQELPALFETHLYTIVAAALCATTLLAPQLLED